MPSFAIKTSGSSNPTTIFVDDDYRYMVTLRDSARGTIIFDGVASRVVEEADAEGLVGPTASIIRLTKNAVRFSFDVSHVSGDDQTKICELFQRPEACGGQLTVDVVVINRDGAATGLKFAYTGGRLRSFPWLTCGVDRDLMHLEISVEGRSAAHVAC